MIIINNIIIINKSFVKSLDSWCLLFLSVLAILGLGFQKMQVKSCHSQPWLLQWLLKRNWGRGLSQASGRTGTGPEVLLEPGSVLSPHPSSSTLSSFPSFSCLYYRDQLPPLATFCEICRLPRTSTRKGQPGADPASKTPPFRGCVCGRDCLLKHQSFYPGTLFIT